MPAAFISIVTAWIVENARSGYYSLQMEQEEANYYNNI
jgi:hypothetical protein